MLEKYGPYLLAGGVILVIILIASGSGGGGSTTVTLPPRVQSVSPGPIDRSYDIARLGAALQQEDLRANVLALFLNRDIQLKAITASEKAQAEQLNLQKLALQYQNDLEKQKLQLQFQSMGSIL
jgi:hypothetical protein